VARSRRFTGVRTRRLVAWTVGPEAQTQTMSSSTPLLGNVGAQIAVERLTVVRIRGYVRLTLSAASAVISGFRGAMGIGRATVEAFDAGQASLRTPLADDDWDGWLWHSYFDIRTVTATIADGVNAKGAIFDMHIDSKAMRKAQNDDVFYFAAAGVETGVATVNFTMSSRMLVKLS